MTNIPKIGILFDLDGVLIDSEHKYSEIWKHINTDFPTGVANLEKVIKGKTLYEILNTYFDDPEIRQKVAQRCIEEESKMVYDFYPEALELLDKLDLYNIPFAMVTSSDGVKMTNLRRQHPWIDKRFGAIIDGDIVSRSKPDPQGYLMAADRLGLKARNCAVFEDSLSGMKAGNAADAFVVGLTDTIGRDAVKGNADIIIDKLNELDLENLLVILNNR